MTDSFESTALPFRIAAPSMVFGIDPLENIRQLAGLVDQVELVLFQTPDLHNIPSPGQIRQLSSLLADRNLAVSVHLPSSLQIAAADRRRRRTAVQAATSIIERMSPLQPSCFILHVPIAKPTLTAIPGAYLTADRRNDFTGWSRRARSSLQEIAASTDARLLVENINFSPEFLRPFWEEALCGLCLDIGHLMLGAENVQEVLEACFPAIEEIHLHGVKDWIEHISAAEIPSDRLRRWMNLLRTFRFAGTVNLEVFSPPDLYASLAVLKSAWKGAECRFCSSNRQMRS